MSLGSLIPPEPLAIVRFRFECGDVHWFVRRVELDEALGRPFSCVLELVTEQTDLIVDELLGANAVLEIDRDDMVRAVKGCVHEIEDLGMNWQAHARQVRVSMGPALSFLARSRRSRIFQALNVLEVIEGVLLPIFQARGRSVSFAAVEHPRRPSRDFCVQYDESDLDFIHRLLEEEGLTYWFDHAEGEHETLVVVGSNDDLPRLDLADGSASVPVLADREAAGLIECISSFTWRRRPRAVRVNQRDWDWKSDPPAIHEEAYEGTMSDDGELAPAPAAELWQSGDHRLLDLALGDRARRKQEALTMAATEGQGVSNVIGFAPGRRFELEHEDRQGLMLLTHVTHIGEAPELAASIEERTRYENHFRCIPAATSFRPLRSTPRPAIHGPQTAVVTGPEREEIHTDEHGRIKVRMHWDRSGHPPEDASCWIRVAQLWGGPGWGAVFIPRVGMEVIVMFLQGDPDRPICMGCVYNGGNRPPYPLPDEKTKSTIKTSSSPGGDGYNELTFEDAAGAEQIILHAQRNLDESVGNDHSTSVGGSQSVSVGGSQSITVTKNRSETVKGNVKIDVTGTRTETVKELELVTLEKARETRVGGDELHDVTHLLTEVFRGGRTTTVVTDDAEAIIAGNKSVAVEQGALTVQALTKIEIAQNQAHRLVLENEALLQTAGDFTITNGRVTVKSIGGVLELHAADELSLKCGNASITLTQSGEVEVQGTKKATVVSNQSSLSAEPAGVTTSGPKLTAQATGLHEIKGALIKIN